MPKIDIEELFRSHKLNPEQQLRVHAIQDETLSLAHKLVAATPESAEQTLGLRKLKEASMQFVLSICMNEETQ